MKYVNLIFLFKKKPYKNILDKSINLDCKIQKMSIPQIIIIVQHCIEFNTMACSVSGILSFSHYSWVVGVDENFHIAV